MSCALFAPFYGLSRSTRPLRGPFFAIQYVLTRGRAPFLDSSVHFYCLTVTVCHCVIAGYETHLVGKWHLGFHKWPYVPTRRGFKSSYGYWDGAEDHFSHKVSGVLDFHDQEEPVRNMDGTYATYAFVEVNRTSQWLVTYTSGDTFGSFFFSALLCLKGPPHP